MSAEPPLSAETKAGLVPPVTVCVLCYGDYPELAHRVLEPLVQFAKSGQLRLRLGLNSVSARTEAVVTHLLPHLQPEMVLRADTNLFKMGMMRRLFYSQPLTTPWVLWFDDDSFVERCDWLEILSRQSRLQPAIDMWGQPLFIRVDHATLAFIRSAPWFRGVALEEDDQPGVYRLNFIAGGYWAIRAACLHQLNWPDERLLHFGDDYLLGEALRQNGLSIGKCISGVAINQSHRRAPAETPRCHVLH